MSECSSPCDCVAPVVRCSLRPMHPSFWSATKPVTGSGKANDCDACSQCPVDDWLIPCSSPDCTIPQSTECTDKCVVVTHTVEAPCDGHCDGATTDPCDMACDGFDTNWVCGDGDNCSGFGTQFTEDMKGFSQQMQALSQMVDQSSAFAPFYDFNQCFGHTNDMTHSGMLSDNMHIHQLPPTFTSFASPLQMAFHTGLQQAPSPSMASATTSASASYQNSPSPMLMQPVQQQQQSDLACLWSDCNAVFPSSGDLFAHLNSLHIPSSTSEQQQQQQQQQQSDLMCLWSDCHAVLPSTNDLSAHLTSLHIPSTSERQPPPYQHQHQPNGQHQHPELACLWSDCHAVFPSTGDLFTHLTSQHIPNTTTAVQQLHQSALLNSLPTSCLWDDCSVFPDLNSIPGPSVNPSPGAVSQFLTAHLLQDHLGLQRPPPTPTHASQQPISLHPSPGPASTRAATIEPSEEDSTSSSAQSSALPTLALPDAQTQAHPCLWSGCDEVFNSCDALTAHIAATHVGTGKAQYECQWRGCARTGAAPFASKQKILRHMQSHTGHRPFQCTVCEQNFSEAATLQQHMRRHTHEKPYLCDFPGCGKAFAITGALTIHKRIHNGERPFKCTYCARAFSESSNLSKHLRTHTGARPYPCPEPGCEKRFARPDQVARHANVHRKVKAEAVA